MASTSVLVVYSKKTGSIRRIIDPDADHEIANVTSFIMPGEAALLVLRTAIATASGSIDAAFAALRGVAVPPAQRCIVVNSTSGSGVITQVVLAEPGLDSIPGTQLIASAAGQVGDSWNGTQVIPLHKAVKRTIGTPVA